RDPLFRPRPFYGAPRRQRGTVESLVDVVADGARLAERHIAVAHDRDLAKGVNGVDLRRMRQRGSEGVRHAFFVAGDADHADIIALRCADDLKLGHGSAPVWSMSDRETT